MNNLYIDIHAVQTVPSSCINRDDTGTPKTAVYGGVNRARVSSQSWKRAMRQMFTELLPEDQIGKRTKKIVSMVKSEILKLAPNMEDTKAEKMAINALSNAGLKIKNAKIGTDALLLMSQKQAAALAELAVAEEKDKEVYKKALRDNPSVDMALFGRMVASDPSLNYDAASQVAHAISTHAVTTEYDYFTAVDDLGDEDSAGAGHIGVHEFNSSTLYRYANLNAAELYKNIGGAATLDAVNAFLTAFVKSMPTGSQNSYANRTVPSSVYISIRTDQPVSFAGAFERPIPTSNEGYESRSQKAFVEYAKKLEAQELVEHPLVVFAVGDGLDELAKPQPFPTVLNEIHSKLAELLPDGDK